jgi:hypothetical protein
VTAERSDAKFSLLNGGVGSVGFLQIGVSSYDEGSTAKLMAIGNVKPMQSDMEAGNASDRAPLGSQPPIFVRRHDANRSGVVHYDLDPPHFAGNADAHQDAPEGAPARRARPPSNASNGIMSLISTPASKRDSRSRPSWNPWDL